MFDPNKYVQPTARRQPVILLLDVSRSMQGDKIDKLYEAVTDMVDSFVKEALKEVEINVAIFTFGSKVELHTPYTSVKELQANGIKRFNADGMTPLGAVLTMAKSYIDDKDETKGTDYRPAVVLVSDGKPNDSWEGSFDSFINDGRSAKSSRMAVPIGNDVDRAMLERFTGDPNMVFFAENADKIADSFKLVVMSTVEVARKQSQVNMNQTNAQFDGDPNSVKTSSVQRRSVTSKRKSSGKNDDDDLGI